MTSASLRARTRVGPGQKYLILCLEEPLPLGLLIAEGKPWEDLQFSNIVSIQNSRARDASLEFDICRDAEVAGVFVWMRFKPSAEAEWLDCFEVATSWPILFFPLRAPESLRKNDKIGFQCSSDPNSFQPTYNFACSALSWDVELTLADLYPWLGGDCCALCDGTSASLDDLEQNMLDCPGCSSSFHISCITLAAGRKPDWPWWQCPNWRCAVCRQIALQPAQNKSVNHSGTIQDERDHQTGAQPACPSAFSV